MPAKKASKKTARKSARKAARKVAKTPTSAKTAKHQGETSGFGGFLFVVVFLFFGLVASSAAASVYFAEKDGFWEAVGVVFPIAATSFAIGVVLLIFLAKKDGGLLADLGSLFMVTPIMGLAVYIVYGFLVWGIFGLRSDWGRPLTEFLAKGNISELASIFERSESSEKAEELASFAQQLAERGQTSMAYEVYNEAVIEAAFSDDLDQLERLLQQQRSLTD